jgi:hypothetical protein
MTNFDPDMKIHTPIETPYQKKAKTTYSRRSLIRKGV